MIESSTKSRSTKTPPAAFWIGAVAGTSLVSLVFVKFGLPLDRFTWLGVLVGIVPVAAAWRRHFLSWSFAAAIILYYLTFFFPLERNVYQDVHGGRFAYEILPHGFRFGFAGPNTRLLEERLGSLDAQWIHLGIDFMLLGTWRDGNERVNCHNLIFSSDLPAILDRLPDDEARQEVLICLTDSSNLLRIHQGLLLTILNELDYPPGLDSQSWWAKHSWIFQCERDPSRAAKIAWGWQEKLPKGNEKISSHLRGISYQERGSWGGDPDFGEAVFTLQEQMHAGGNKVDPQLGVNRIAWWPKAIQEEVP